MKPISIKAIVVAAIVFLTACKKNQSAADPDQPTSVDQVKKLLVGDWIEDSVNIEYTQTVAFIAPSYLNVDSNLHYRLEQTSGIGSPANNWDASDTGQFTNIAVRYITPNSTYNNNDFLGNYGPMQINVLTEHKMVLFGYIVIAGPPTFYFHR